MTASPPSSETLFRGEGVLEGPTFETDNKLLFSNVTKGGVFRLDLRDRSVECVVPHRRGIGGLALTEDGNIVVSGRNVAIKPKGSSETVVLLAGEALGHPVTGFNDLTVDPEGRVVVGSLGPGALSPHSLSGKESPPADGAGSGAIYSVDASGHRQLAIDIGHPNGIAFSPDGTFAYVSDTIRRRVYRFRVSSNGWSDRTIFAQFDAGLPDGMAMDSQGSLWFALALRSRIVVLAKSGEVRETYAMPNSLTTSLRFGGADMKTIVVTGGSHDGSEPATIVRFRAPVAGYAVPRARVAAT